MTRPTKSTSQTSVWPLCALIAALGLSGCDREPEAHERADNLDTTPSVDPEPSVENVEDHPEQFVGREVILAGEVDEVYSDRAFELEELTWLFDDEVLVLTRSPVKLGNNQLRDDAVVSVSGTVKKLVVADIERELGWHLDEELEVEWRDKPVIVADSIEAIHNYARWSEKDDPDGVLVSMWAVRMWPTPLDLEGSTIDLDSALVAERGQSGLWLGYEGAPELYVVAGEGEELGAARAGNEIDVEGTLKRMPESSEAAKRWKLSGAEKQRIEGEPLYLEASELSVVPAEPES